ncbi:hypothetical protein OH784_14270 [Ectobacillus funiculus]|uniref:hypothetical protein n=1 Tax=Ectobacillus funiculus TaxID=137993 RepID=UPI00397C5C12
MLLKKLFFSSDKNDKYCKMEQKLRLLELEIQKLQLLEKQWEKLQEENTQPPVVIEKVHIDKIVFDKFELNNNFGQLGIKELKGRLNIGATYGNDFLRPETEEEAEQKQEGVKKERKKPEKPQEDGPKINIQPRRENVT